MEASCVVILKWTLAIGRCREKSTRWSGLISPPTEARCWRSDRMGKWVLKSIRRMIHLARTQRDAAFMAFMERQILDLRERYSREKRLEP
jgi:hypothetical protein